MEEEIRPSNMMWDRRIVRGNTYASMVIPNNQQEQYNLEKEQEKERKLKMKMKKENELKTSTEQEVEPLHNRINVQVDCITGNDAILKPIELWDKPPDREIDIQTDFYIDRPPTPRFIPTKTGKDVSTQILDGELFDFDNEVMPILEVLVGKTLEQARMEVLEENELEMMMLHQREFEKIRDAELIEAQRMEKVEERLFQETNRRKQEAMIANKQNKIAHMK